MSDIMRLNPKKLTTDDIAKIEAIKTAGNHFVNILRSYEPMDAGRETALAVTNAEQAVMWMIKGLTK